MCILRSFTRLQSRSKEYFQGSGIIREPLIKYVQKILITLIRLKRSKGNLIISVCEFQLCISSKPKKAVYWATMIPSEFILLVMLSEKVAVSDWLNFLFHTLASQFYEEKDTQSAASFGDIRQLREVAK